MQSANDDQKWAIKHNIEKAQKANLDRCNATRQNRGRSKGIPQK